MNKHKSNKIKDNYNTVRYLIMGQITTTQNLVAIKEVRHAGQSSRYEYMRRWVFCWETTHNLQILNFNFIMFMRLYATVLIKSLRSKATNIREANLVHG